MHFLMNVVIAMLSRENANVVVNRSSAVCVCVVCVVGGWWACGVGERNYNIM